MLHKISVVVRGKTCRRHTKSFHKITPSVVSRVLFLQQGVILYVRVLYCVLTVLNKKTTKHPEQNNTLFERVLLFFPGCYLSFCRGPQKVLKCLAYALLGHKVVSCAGLFKKIKSRCSVPRRTWPIPPWVDFIIQTASPAVVNSFDSSWAYRA